ncbi:putative phosphothreonine lyase domain-containing protein [Burkholderia pseudomallei]|uniref:putative phosphothreonine lyase domain-containing protein n=1 Tax=Burkholderia pseudomallei TaxID=28450 RepID=UPI0005370619|nr:putative phosphothreonine lyase domain-containg protein [Burkholderia pseudomallei]KGW56589.1 hypothetical protein Y042_1708 [Burkholderia pseudomallei MSHR1357]KKC13310.1 hypothetical protein BBL_4731 [Burkholderia pseudomallei MSHR1328]
MSEQSRLMEQQFRKSEKPSEDHSRNWHTKASPNCKRFSSGDTTGKWCIFVSQDEVDAAWDKIKGALEQSQLLCAKVSTAIRSMGRDAHVICVYTQDWTDTQELMRSRNVLLSLGFTEELGYKRDIDTRDGNYGPNEWYLRV